MNKGTTFLLLVGLLLLLGFATSLRHPGIDLQGLVSSTPRAERTKPDPAETTPAEPTCEAQCRLRKYFGMPRSSIKNVKPLATQDGSGQDTSRPKEGASTEGAKRMHNCVPRQWFCSDDSCTDRVMSSGQRPSRAPAGAKGSGSQSIEDALANVDKITWESWQFMRRLLDGACEAYEVGRDSGYRFDFLMATVPDPLDSPFDLKFDQALESIRLAAENHGYVLDRFYNPWDPEQAAAEKDKNWHRTHPGVLIFRKISRYPTHQQARRLLLVFLIGETPTAGVHQVALKSSLDFIAVHAENLWQEAQRSPREGPPHASPSDPRKSLPQEKQCTSGSGEKEDGPDLDLFVLGPNFSGAAASLQYALKDWFAEVREARCCKDKPACRNGRMFAWPWHFGRVHLTILSGNATALSNAVLLEEGLKKVWPFAPSEGEKEDRDKGIEPPLPTSSVSFHAMTWGDDVLNQTLRWFLTDKLRIEPQHTAILYETNTAYGQGYSTGDDLNVNPMSHQGDERSLYIPFPIHAARLRQESERERHNEGDERRLTRPGIDLTLGETRNASDVLRPVSKTTGPASELVLHKAIDLLREHNIRAVGIVATDARDVIFLAQEMRRFTPDLQLFTFESDILYLHEDLSYLQGMLIVSSYPLLPWNSIWTYAPTARQLIFPTSKSQGTYNAMAALLGKMHPLDLSAGGVVEYGQPLATIFTAEEVVPRVGPGLWITVVGNGAFWPVYSDTAKTVLQQSRSATEEPGNQDAAPASSKVAAHRDLPQYSKEYPQYLENVLRKEPLGIEQQFRQATLPGKVGVVLFLLGALGLLCLTVFHFRPFMEKAAPSLMELDFLRGLARAAGAGEQPFWALGVFLLLFCSQGVAHWLVFGGFKPFQPPSGWWQLLYEEMKQLGWSGPLFLVLRCMSGACLGTLGLTLLLIVLPSGRPGPGVRVRGLVLGLAALCGALLSCLILGMEGWTDLREDSFVGFFRWWRAAELSSGVSWAAAAMFLGAALLVLILHELARLERVFSFGEVWKLFSQGEGSLLELAGLRSEGETAYACTKAGGPQPWMIMILVAISGLAVATAVRHLSTPLEGEMFRNLMMGFFMLPLLGVCFYFLRFLHLWQKLKRILDRLSSQPIAEAFHRVPSKMLEAYGRPWGQEVQETWAASCRLLGAQLRQHPELLKNVHGVVTPKDQVDVAEILAGPDTAQGAGQLLSVVNAFLARVLGPLWRGYPHLVAGHDDPPTSAPSLPKGADLELSSSSTMELYVHDVRQHLQLWVRLAEEIVAAEWVGFIGYLQAQLHGLLTVVTAGMLLLLMAVSFYPFNGSGELLTVVWTVVLVTLLLSFVVFVQMSRNDTLRRIGKDAGGQAALDQKFILGVLSYGGVPVLGLLAVQFPTAGKFLFAWFKPVMSLLGR